MSRTVLRALAVNWWINPAYWTVVELSIVVLIGMPIRKRRALSKRNNSGGSSRVSNTRNWDGVVPSTLTTIIPITPLWLWILFSDSSTSDCQEEKKIVIRHDHKESKHEKVNCNSHHFHFLFGKISATLPRNGTAMYGGRFFLSPANKGQLFF